MAHRERAQHKAAHPLHVTMRARPLAVSLRRGDVFARIRDAIAAAHKETFRILHLSVQADHIHLVVEAQDKRALTAGMRGLAVRIGHAVNRRLGLEGRLFRERYHAREVTSPREVRNVLVYVLMNHKHHGWTGDFDSCSSAAWFDGFTSPPPPPTAPVPPIRPPRTWLAKKGWKMHGLIRPSEAPVDRPKSSATRRRGRTPSPADGRGAGRIR